MRAPPPRGPLGGRARAGLGRVSFPLVLLALLLAVWICLGLWICAAAPYGSGTDESIRYVAFAAAANRWATAEDAAARGIEHSYYPPLYFLLFAPFYGDESSFNERYPPGDARDPNYPLGGSNLLVSKEYLAGIPPELLRLYRAAKLLSLAFGVGIVVCLVAALRLLFDGPQRHWLVLGGTAPLLLLPQFLYYQTLVNNDALVNFLSACALLCFIAAVRRESRGDRAGARRLSLACAVAVGLGLLTKQSAFVVLPLLPCLAALPLLFGEGEPLRARAAKSLRLLLVLAALTVACGGWWLLRMAMTGDPIGVQTAIAAHPWEESRHAVTGEQIATLAGRLARSYIALFAGSQYGIPDVVYALYLGVAAALGAAVATVTTVTLRWPLTSALSSGSAPRRFTWLVLAGTVLVNLALIFVYNLRVYAPYGRLLFPSLVASHAIFALLLGRLAGASRTTLAAAVCALTLALAGLFTWTFLNRMIPAVAQQAEHLVALATLSPSKGWRYGPAWKTRILQPLLLHPGRLTGFRLFLDQSSTLPQFGTVLHARLLTKTGAGLNRKSPFKPCPVGDNGSNERALELVLEEPFDSTGGPAALLLEADKPWFSPPGTESHYVLVPPGTSPLLRPLIIDGAPMDAVLALTAVYQ